jgi:hypothetical protein
LVVPLKDFSEVDIILLPNVGIFQGAGKINGRPAPDITDKTIGKEYAFRQSKVNISDRIIGNISGHPSRNGYCETIHG